MSLAWIGKSIGADLRQPRRQPVDGIVRHGPRGMAARIGHFQLVVLGKFLRRLDGHHQGLAVGVQPPAAAFVQREFRIDQVALMGGKPARAIEGGGGFLAAGQRHLDGAAVLEAFLLQPHHGVHPGRDLGLHVGGAAAVEIAILLDEGEGIAGPVGALGFHHIDMAQQQNGLGLGIAARQHRHQPAFLGMAGDGEVMQVGVRIAGLLSGAPPILCARRCSRPPTGWCWFPPALYKERGSAHGRDRTNPWSVPPPARSKQRPIAARIRMRMNISPISPGEA